MKALFNTLTDKQRIATLNSLYQKGMNTRKEDLSFSAEKLVYVKPFITQLLNAASSKDFSTKLMVRQVVDELLKDIFDEVALSCNRNGNYPIEQAANELGLSMFLTSNSKANYELRKVA